MQAFADARDRGAGLEFGLGRRVGMDDAHVAIDDHGGQRQKIQRLGERLRLLLGAAQNAGDGDRLAKMRGQQAHQLPVLLVETPAPGRGHDGHRMEVGDGPFQHDGEVPSPALRLDPVPEEGRAHELRVVHHHGVGDRFALTEHQITRRERI